MIACSRRFTLVLLAALVACTAGSPPPGEAAGTISGVITYGGTEPGVLRVAVFAAFPPRGAPVAEIAIDDPTFPQPYLIHQVPPGRYFVLAMVDTSPDDGDRYRPRVDPGGTFGRYDSPAPITIGTTGAATAVDVGLVAPAPGSPWDR